MLLALLADVAPDTTDRAADVSGGGDGGGGNTAVVVVIVAVVAAIAVLLLTQRSRGTGQRRPPSPF